MAPLRAESPRSQNAPIASEADNEQRRQLGIQKGVRQSSRRCQAASEVFIAATSMRLPARSRSRRSHPQAVRPASHARQNFNQIALCCPRVSGSGVARFPARRAHTRRTSDPRDDNSGPRNEESPGACPLANSAAVAYMPGAELGRRRQVDLDEEAMAAGSAAGTISATVPARSSEGAASTLNLELHPHVNRGDRGLIHRRLQLQRAGADRSAAVARRARPIVPGIRHARRYDSCKWRR